MKVVLPSTLFTRTPVRQIDSLSVPPFHYQKDVENDLDTERKVGCFMCQPVSAFDGKIESLPGHRLFRSLENCLDYELCNGVECLVNDRNHSHHHNCKSTPSPPRSPLFVSIGSSVRRREVTPPTSPFGSKNHNIMATKILKTPSSARTAETESITSLSSCGTANTNSIITMTTPSEEGQFIVANSHMTAPRTSVGAPMKGYSYQYQGHDLNPYSHIANVTPMFHPTAEATSGAYKSNGFSGYLTKPKAFCGEKQKLITENCVSDFQPFDNRNHYRYSTNANTSSYNRIYSTSGPSVDLDNFDSVPSNLNSSETSHINRRKKVKTELCMYHLANEICPFGAKCHYAHGEEELQTKGLLELQNSGLIEDASTYRIKPCFSHVAMGSCPFGKRCACIHDPRVTGTLHSWLPITETQGNNLTTDINVEGLHQKRRFDILYGDPFVGGSRLSALFAFGGGDSHDDFQYTWSDLYNMVANNDKHQTSCINVGGSRCGGSNIGFRKRRQSHVVGEVHKLSIAIQMHGGTHRWMYKYRPSHVIFNEQCMVLDKRAFRLDGTSGRAIPLSLSKYRPGNPTHCIVREIAFGPDQDPSVRPVALYFNISDNSVSECNIYKQKLFRWHKKKKLPNAINDPEFRKAFSSSPFDCRDSFVMNRPIDGDAFSLVRSILEHRYAVLLAERITSMRERSATLEKLSKQHSLLHGRFAILKRNWAAWTYPIISGRPSIDNSTPAPPAETEYVPSSGSLEETNDSKGMGCLKNETVEMWDSFLSTLQAYKTDNGGIMNDYATGSSYLLGDFSQVVKTDRIPCRKRLSVFVRLCHGGILNDENRSLPHIKGYQDDTTTAISNSNNSSNNSSNSIYIHSRWSSSKRKESDTKPKYWYLRQSERCWKSLMLPNDGLQDCEWDVVVDNFTKPSRSQKVLNIVQQ